MRAYMRTIEFKILLIANSTCYALAIGAIVYLKCF
jgi:hypothetical protein